MEKWTFEPHGNHKAYRLIRGNRIMGEVIANKIYMQSLIERLDRCDQLEMENEKLMELYDEIKPHMLRMEPDVIAYKSTPSLVPHAERVERFMTIMRDALKDVNDANN